MTPAQDLVFLLDVDNTLLDGDRIVADFTRHLEGELASVRPIGTGKIFATLREELGYVDYLGALQRCRW